MSSRRDAFEKTPGGSALFIFMSPAHEENSTLTNTSNVQNNFLYWPDGLLQSQQFIASSSVFSTKRRKSKLCAVFIIDGDEMLEC